MAASRIALILFLVQEPASRKLRPPIIGWRKPLSCCPGGAISREPGDVLMQGRSGMSGGVLTPGAFSRSENRTQTALTDISGMVASRKMNFIKRLFGKKQEARAVEPPKERPADWHWTISDLMQEMKAGKREQIGQQELNWAKEYERSLIPEGTRFPAKGDVYEALHDQTVTFVTAWAAP